MKSFVKYSLIGGSVALVVDYMYAYKNIRYAHRQLGGGCTNSLPAHKTAAFALLPVHTSSRITGYLAHLNLPPFVLTPIFRWFIKKYNVDMSLAVQQDLSQFSSFSSFFKRDVIPELRPISASELVSPCDAKVVRCGPIESREFVHDVKGNSYRLATLLGEETSDNLPKAGLHHIVFYLSPADYHHFHSPAEWTVSSRNYCAGTLFSVKEKWLQRMHGLLAMNERAAYLGSWRHGFFSLVAVAAANVGNIHVVCDEDLSRAPKGVQRLQLPDPKFQRGANFGYFDLGSTVVLIFQAPKDFKLNIKAGDKVNFGQSIGDIASN